jgi:ubiquinone/menaquinone biosynthesis C-methylase UbiE
MIPSEYEKLNKLQSSYWWFRGKRHLIQSFMTRTYPDQRELRILDAGCGTGHITRILSEYGRVSGVDVSELALEFCSQNGIDDVRRGSISELPFGDDYFDLVAVINVLYHKGVEDDDEAIREVFRVVKPGGRALVTASAMKCLFGRNDVVQHGVRRYSRTDLIAKFASAGFVHDRSSYFTFSHFPFIYLTRKWQELTDAEVKSDSDEDINPIINAVSYWWFRRELDLMRFVRYPFGAHLFATFLKPRSPKSR